MTLFGKKRTKVEETLNGIIQRDEYLDIIKRMGIPTATSDSLDADGISQFKLIYNTTLGKLRIHNGISWVDAVPADLSNYYTKAEIDLLFNTVNTNIAILQGLYLEANQTTAEIYLKDGDNNILSTLNVGFLNNEGTTFSYNAIDNTLELKNDNNEILTVIPVSSFISNLAATLAFNGTTPYTLELKDNEGTVVSSVNITINNVQGLQTALDSKEPLITILPVTKGGTGNNSITENSFFIGGPTNTMVEKTPQEIINLILSVGNGLDFTDNILKVASVSSARIVVNPSGIDLAQTAVSAGTWTKVTVDNYGRVTSATNATLADFSAIAQSIHDLTTDGIIVKNGAGTVTRTITGTSGRISVSNGDGVAGNPTIDLVPTSVVPGTYNTVTVDDYGRVTNASNVETGIKFVPNTIFVNGTSGVDATAAIERIDKPYLTIDAAIAAIPTGQLNVMWTIWMLTPTTFTINNKLTAGQNITFKSLTKCILTTSINNDCIINGGISINAYTWNMIFDFPYGEFKITTVTQLHQNSNFETFQLFMDVGTLNLIGNTLNPNWQYLMCGEFTGNFKKFITNRSSIGVYNTTSTKLITLNIGEFNSSNSVSGTCVPLTILHTTIPNKNAKISIDSITGNGSVSLTNACNNKVNFIVGNINITNSLYITNYNSLSSFEGIFYFNNSSITATVIYLWHSQAQIYLEGEIKYMSVAPFNNIYLGSGGKLGLRNFTANFLTTIFQYYQGTVTIEDCNLTINTSFVNFQATASDDTFKFIGHNTIRQITSSQLFLPNGKTVGRLWVEGTLMTNASIIGLTVYNLLADFNAARVANTIFVGGAGASDSNGVPEVPTKPYATLTKALEVRSALSIASGSYTYDKNWTIVIQDNGSYSVTKDLTTNNTSATNIQISSLNINSFYTPTITLTKPFTIDYVDLKGINLTITIEAGNTTIGSFNGGNLQINTLTITGISTNYGLITNGSYQNYYIEHFIANNYSAIGVTGGTMCLTQATIKKMTNNGTLFHASLENSRLQIVNDNFLIQEIINAANIALSIQQIWSSSERNTTIKLRKITNSGGNIVNFTFNTNPAPNTMKILLDLDNGTFENFYINSPYYDQPARITGRCSISYSVSPTKSFITVDRNTKTISSYGESFMLKDLRAKITYPSTPSWSPIRITGANSSTEQKQIILEDCFIETSHAIEIFTIINGVSTNTESIIQFRGTNDFKNGKELILATSVTPTNPKFITSRGANIRHDFGVVSTNTNLQIFNESNSLVIPYTVYINTVSGNNTTAVLGDVRKPFLTDTEAYNALPTDDGNIWNFVFICNNVTRTLGTLPTRKIKYICYNIGTIDASIFNGGISVPLFHFEIPNGTFKHETTTQTTLASPLDMYIHAKVIDVRTPARSNSINVFQSGGLFKAESFIERNNTGKSMFAGQIIAGTFNTTGTVLLHQTAETRISINELILNGQNISLSTNAIIPELPINKISGTGTFSTTNLNKIDISKLNSTSGIQIYVSKGTILTGMVNKSFLGTIALDITGPAKIESFYGKLQMLNASAGYYFSDVEIKNSTIFLDNLFFTGWSGYNGPSRNWYFNNVEIIQTTPGPLCANMGVNTTNIFKTGFLKSNGTFGAEFIITDRTPNSF